nr:MAG TPA: hypothetical protein [Caudoviricetes sp.]
MQELFSNRLLLLLKVFLLKKWALRVLQERL